ncbi:MAG TPA: hypothetical protein VFH62_02545 [Dehalococcoidia bacterium]|nr:hypothetical protein [Dehalococcoidia bacterium]
MRQLLDESRVERRCLVDVSACWSRWRLHDGGALLCRRRGRRRWLVLQDLVDESGQQHHGITSLHTLIRPLDWIIGSVRMKRPFLGVFSRNRTLGLADKS